MQEARVHEFFNAYAGDFNAIYGNRNTAWNGLINRLFRKSMRLRFERTLAGCDPIKEHSAIDIGCGPGHYAIELARRGARRVLGIDFSPAMIELAQENARQAGVSDQCEFRVADFFQIGNNEQFDYSIAMGFMDYIPQPKPLIERVFALTRRKAFFSFPLAGGPLAWQRKLRYRRRCELYLYDLRELERLFESVPSHNFLLQPIARDAFVTAVPRALAACGTASAA